MRLLVVSNRLPVTVAQDEKGRLKFKESAGGLVSGISAYLDSLKTTSVQGADYVWVGWPGVDVRGKTRNAVKTRLQQESRAFPVFLSDKAMDKFYHGFCNKTIWPLFHYFPSYSVYNEEYWTTYREVNRAFCDAVLEVYQPGDVVWIHDYHLMLLPELLRRKAPNASIGFFLHIPFPSFEIFRLLPAKWRTEILEGLLGADLVGFHTHDYTQEFLRCILRILGHEHNMGFVPMRNRMVRVDTFPMGIDFKRYADTVTDPLTVRERGRLSKTLAGYKVVSSIDRLDYTKGTPNRLQAYEAFLEMNPSWHGKVVMVMIVVPSRVGVDHYQAMKRQTDELVGRINGRFGSVGWTPIIYQYRFLPLNALGALYSMSDVALVTPLRDGMNLVAKEYVAARTEGTGVLVLSEMAGASKELGEAIIVNPNSIADIAAALKSALEMPREEQIRRVVAMRRRLQRYDVTRWASDFIKALYDSRDETAKLEARLLGREARGVLLAQFKVAQRRLLLLDYDGTLVPFADRPELATPTQAVRNLLGALAQQQATATVLISGRDRAALEDWFGSLDIGLVAEHGAWIRESGKAEWRLLKPLTTGWKTQIIPIMELYSDLVPGSMVEVKEYSVAWHYRRAEPALAAERASELRDHLVQHTANIDLQVLQGSKVVEVRNAGVNKGAAALHWLAGQNHDFVLGIGDDWTDEDMFRALPAGAFTIKVGMGSTIARFNIADSDETVRLLEELAGSDGPGH